MSRLPGIIGYPQAFETLCIRRYRRFWNGCCRSPETGTPPSIKRAQATGAPPGRGGLREPRHVVWPVGPTPWLAAWPSVNAPHSPQPGIALQSCSTRPAGAPRQAVAAEGVWRKRGLILMIYWYAPC